MMTLALMRKGSPHPLCHAHLMKMPGTNGMMQRMNMTE